METLKKDHYKQLLLTMPSGYALHKIVLDDKGKPCDYIFLDVNPAFENITGLKASEIINKRITEVLPDITDDVFDWIGFYGEIALGEPETEFEQFSSALQRWYRINVYSPEKMHFVTIFTDITEMKQVQEEQAIMADNIDTQIWFLKDLETYGMVNQAHADFMGFDKEELQNRSFREILDKKEAEICIESNKRVFNEKKPVKSEEWVVNASGERRLLRVSKRPRLNDQGKVQYVVCSAEDITDCKNARLALKESEEKFRRIFKHSPLGIIRIDNNGVITDCNDNLVSIIGSSYDDIIGLNMLDLPDKKVVEAMRKTLQGEITTYEGDYHSVTSDKVTPVRGIFAPVKSDSGEILEVICIVEDNSERKKAEELIHENLKEKNALLSEIHHRVKNNMAVISSLLSLQSGYHNGKDPDYFLQETRNRVHSMALVHELVYENENFAEIPFNKLLQRLAENLQDVYNTSDRKITISVDSDEVLLDTNQSVPCSLLVNELISNACLHAFTNRFQGKIKVTLRKNEYGYRLKISDNGKGVSDPDLLRNPDTFGYTIIHGLVKQIGGYITIESPENSGLSVEISFKPDTNGEMLSVSRPGNIIKQMSTLKRKSWLKQLVASR